MGKLPPPLPSAVSANTKRFELLVVFHYVFSGFALLGCGFLFLHYSMMNMVFGNPELFKGDQNAPFDPGQFIAAFKWFYIVMGVVMVTGMVLNVASGLALSRRRHRMFSLVVAAIDCLQIPFGTALGVFTIMHLLKDSVIAEYLGKRAEESAIQNPAESRAGQSHAN